MSQDPRTLERFWAKVDKTATCWNWTGASRGPGYGAFHVGTRAEGNRKTVLAHRFSFAASSGILLDGMQIDHLCKNRRCVNPAHLEQVLGQVNNARSGSPTGVNGRKTHCKSGHEFTPDNTHIRPNGARSCRTCRRAWATNSYRASRAKSRTVSK